MMTISCFFAIGIMSSVVGPGMGSAASYQRASWRGQKYGQEVMTRILSVLPSILPKNLKITNATLELYE